MTLEFVKDPEQPADVPVPEKPAPTVREPVSLTQIKAKLDIAAVVAKFMPLYRRTEKPFMLFGQCPFCGQGEIEVVWPQNLCFTTCCKIVCDPIGFVQLKLRCNVFEAIAAISMAIFGDAFPPDPHEIELVHGVVKQPGAKTP